MAEQEWVVDLTGAGFVATGVVGQLHVSDFRKVLLQRWRDVAFHDLHVVDVVLNEEIMRTDVVDDLCCLLCSGEKESGDIAGVDWLNQQLDALTCQSIRCKAKV